jgi:hypothetical protein
MQSHLRSVVLCLISTSMVGFKVFWNFYVDCGERVQPLQSVKLIDQPCSRSRAVWTLTWLMNLKMDLIRFMVIYVALLSTNHKCTHLCIMLFREEPWRGVHQWLPGVLKHAIHRSDAYGRWRWSRIFTFIVVHVKTFVSTLMSVIKVNKPLLYVLSNVMWYYTHLSIICVNFLSWHTYEMHLVFIGKTGVTIPKSQCHRPQDQDHLVITNKSSKQRSVEPIVVWRLLSPSFLCCGRRSRPSLVRACPLDA